MKIDDVVMVKRCRCIEQNENGLFSLYPAVLLREGTETDCEIRICRTCSKIIHHAASEQDPECQKALLDHGADINAQCELCPNTLMVAVIAENMPDIRLLVDRGLDMNQGDWYGRTHLFLASKSMLDNSVKTLLELGG
jgi:hypothetical protein